MEQPKEAGLRIPAGLKCLRLFYLFLFFANLIGVIYFGKVTVTVILGRPLASGEDTLCKTALAFWPLAVYYFGFVKYYVYGCYFAIIYQGFFLLNSCLALAGNLSGYPGINPILTIAGTPGVVQAGSRPALFTGIMAGNILIGLSVIIYLIRRISWYKMKAIAARAERPGMRQ